MLVAQSCLTLCDPTNCSPPGSSVHGVFQTRIFDIGYMQNRKRDSDIQNRLLDSVGEGEDGMFRENSIETGILSRVKQITSPGWMHETSARTWCTGKPRGIGWRGRWEGGSGWGTHVNPWLIHVNVWQKPLQYCKVISLQLKKNKWKKKRKKKKNTGVGCYFLLQRVPKPKIENDYLYLDLL